MSGRPFFVPLIGLVLLFAALGPAIGGALFIPLSIVFKAPSDLESIGLMVLIGAMFGHALGLIAAYIVGVVPAAATGFVYALWDAAAPERAPRALVAALIGGVIVYGLLSRLHPVWASFEMTANANMGGQSAEWAFPDRLGVTLGHAFVACAAIAGLVCAFIANLIGLTMRPEPTLADRLHPPGEGG
ncbi:MAG TPA: hypothetical protein VGG79_12585 [Roseiarcus sp.]|jgi:uncharacterized membrane protein YeaQ/YmgE (transglycosylase-associated protein family)